MAIEAPARRVTEPADVASGRYQLGREIGRGGKARVFLARDRLLRRDVAVKVFRARAADPEELRLQEAEAKLVASLNHIALTTLYDAGIDLTDAARPQIYLVMEHVRGGDLRERLRRGALCPLQVGYLGYDIGGGLQYLHDAGFVHRDIKPANVLLDDREETTRIRGKLADFGISSLIGVSEAGESVTGTAAYLSPEQAAGEESGPESDVYSFGLVLLEALTGRVAYPGDIATSALARLDHDPVIPATVPPELGAILRGMTRRDRAQRISLTEAVVRFQDFVVDDLIRRREAGAPDTESIRIEAVRRYDVLDTPPEEAFDEVTDLVRRTLHLPVAIVAVVDEERVWFKSRQGIDLPELPRSLTREVAAGHGEATWNLPDVLAEPSLREHPFVQGPPHVRSALAAPLLTHDGQSIGRLLACDLVVREFTDDEVATLEGFARIVMRELELRLASRRAVFAR
ncbi:protein kinase domain-containing protein [Amnibacterium kyonggiense]|uniref:non-specific serine/threonine protein kinase n=1 Tax=Amnibacterium kyonggiense TaxID=595671 RepID=A0A4R7FRU3_9MICO|nr:protein kinase [Amnibacterium kyonggiense]TDS80555.1 serine/threonine protein kinase [Amnibacterium kyonggiense]